MDAEDRGRIAALEQELQRLRSDLARLTHGPPDPASGPAAPGPPGSWQGPDASGASPDAPGASPDASGASPDASGASPDAPGASPDASGASPDASGAFAAFPLDARWLAVSGILVLAVAAGLFLRDAAQWLAPAFLVAVATALGIAVWSAGVVLRRGPVLAGAGALVTAAAAYASSAAGVPAGIAACAVGAVALAALVDAGLRHQAGQAVVAAVLVPAAGWAGSAWPGPSLGFLAGGSLALLAFGLWKRFEAVPVTVVLGAGPVLVAHAYLGSAPGIVFLAAALLWLACTAAAWLHADIVVQSVAWLVWWGTGAWAMGHWGFDNGWWTAILALVALRLRHTSAPEAVRRTWSAFALAGAIAFPLLLPWSWLVAPVWAVELAVVVLYARRHPTLAAHLTAGLLSGALAAWMAGQWLRVAAGDIGTLAVWLSIVLGLAVSWATIQGAIGRLHLAMAAAGALLLVEALVPGPAVGYVWLALAIAGVAEGAAMRSLDLRVAALAVFGAAVVRLGFDLFDVQSLWRVLALAGASLVVAGAAWWWRGRRAPA